ncbi:MAG: hypothetical protein MPEBLZ_04446, partial [Candidatus Methanoperedens nitroreducens]
SDVYPEDIDIGAGFTFILIFDSFELSTLYGTIPP